MNGWNKIPLLFKSVEKLNKNINDTLKQSKDPKDALRTYPRNPDDGKLIGTLIQII